MRTRNADTPKLAGKTAVKAQPAPASQLSLQVATPKTTETKRVSAVRGTLAKKNESTRQTDSKAQKSSAGKGTEASASTAMMKPVMKVGMVKKSVAKRSAGKAKTPASAKSVSSQTSKSVKAKQTSKEETAVRGQEKAVENVGEAETNKQTAMEVEPGINEDEEDPSEEEDPIEEEDLIEAEKSIVGEAAKSSENEQMEESMDNRDGKDTCTEAATKVENSKDGLQEEDIERVKEMYDGDEQMEYGEKLDLGEHGEEELLEDDIEDPAEEMEILEDEDKQLTAIAKERKMKKEREIFLGGLDRDAEEEDVRRVFKRIGGIVEVRLHKNSSTNKNKGYAFVEFENKERARRALAEMKNPVIRGKRCGTAPSEDNDTLFLGNICNTWTKEAVKQKLKDYGVEGVENINLVPDVQHDGLSRGFAFVAFSCHGDAMLAYKRLQQPDAIFGHAERTAKVAFAEPLREPDPEIMSQVKSVFVDGLPPHWDENQVKEQFKSYGDILRVVLARNMSTAKRRDFGFFDFSTHEAAVAFVDSIKNIELADENSKVKVKARLSNPLPKTQAVKGGMSGGFRIGRGSGGSGGSRGTFPRFVRGFNRGGHHFNHANFQRDRHFYHGGRGQTGRMGFPNEYDYDYPYAEFHRRGEIRGSFRVGHYASGGDAAVAALSSRSYIDGPWHGAHDRGYGMQMPPRRHPYSPERHFGELLMGGHFDEPHFYDDNTQGIKRPFHMRDYDHDYLEPSRRRPRLDYTDPTASFRGNHYDDAYGAGSSHHSHDYYGPEYHSGPYSSYYEGNHSYGGGRYY